MIEARQSQHSRYGALAKALPFTIGNIFFVISPSAEYTGDLTSILPPDTSGKVRVYTDLDAAYAATTSNQNDVIILDGNSTFELDEMLTISKNRVHFIGLDYLLGDKRAYGASTKVQLGVTTAATDIAAVKNTGVRNSFKGIKFISNNTVAESLYTFVDGGEYTYMENCEVYKSTDLDVTGAAEFVCNADSPTYVNSTFGSLADARSGAVIRATMLFTKELAGASKVARDVMIKGCNFWIQSTNTANRFVYGANATDIERAAIFEECRFICNGASTTIPAQNVAFGATLTVGAVLLNRCTSLLASTAMSTTTGVYVDGAVPTAGTTGISVQAS